MNGLRHCIEHELGRLVGQPLQTMGRAADMAWLGFGPLIEVPNRARGGSRTIPRYSIHLQCPFRLQGPQDTLVAAHDMYYSAISPADTSDSFEWDHQGASLYDARVAVLRHQLEHRALVVSAVIADDAGGFRLALNADYAFEVFPATSFHQEHWRFFARDSDAPHFVVFDEDG